MFERHHEFGSDAFLARQARLAERSGSAGVFDVDEGTLIVLPSITFPSEELRKIIGIQHYEERLLFYLLLLASEGLEIVFLTSCPVDEAVVDYYLRLVPDPESARRRLRLLSLNDPLPRSLSAKVMETPGFLDEIKAATGDPTNACIASFNITELEAEISDALDVPIYGPRPDLVHLGSKSGARQIAKRAGVPVLEGTENIYSIEDMASAIAELRNIKRDAEAVVMKLNNGFSGQGNAVLEVADIVDPLTRSPTTFCASEESWPSFERKIAAEGGIVEEMVRPHPHSPSVQVNIAASGEWTVASSHDQILGGPDEQVYLGCRFPAEDSYRADIVTQASLIAEQLAAEGVIGPFGIDFIVLQESHGNRAFLSEINLRMGGTTHPFQTARLATGGKIDQDTGHLLVDGKPKYYVASDNMKSERYVGLSPTELIDRVDRAGLSFDSSSKTGVIMHLFGAVPNYGKLGATCIADTREAAESLFEHVVAEIDELSLRKS
jgi:PGM1 C-terminal domain/ATP-grasp domain